MRPTPRLWRPLSLFLNSAVLLSICCLTSSLRATSFHDTFDTVANNSSTYQTTLSGVPFTYTFTSVGDGGSFFDDGGMAGLLSSNFSSATEVVQLTRSDHGTFTFTSLFISNYSDDITVQGYLNGVPVGSPQTMLAGNSGTLTFGTVTVDEVRLTSTDFGCDIDDFIGDTGPANAAPVVTPTGGSTAFTEGNNVTSTPVAVDSGITVSDSDNTTLASATISITGNFHSGQDILAYTNNPATMGNITASYNSGTGVMTLTSSGSTATLAQWQAALRSVTYTNSSDTPNTSTRTLSFVANDGTSNSAAGTKTVTVSSVDDTSVDTTSGGSAAWTEGNNTVSTPVAVDSGFTVSDADSSTLASAIVAITGNFHSAEDVLVFVNNPATMGNISGSYTAGTGVLSLTSAGATATLAQWQAALRSIAYTDSSNTPNTSTRTISFTTNDGVADGNTATRTVLVTSVNDSPIVTTDSGSASFVAGDNSSSIPVAIDSGVTVSDVDSFTFANAQVAITGNFQSGEDVLAFTNSPGMGNITGSYNASTGVLTLTSAGATATSGQWQSALESVAYTDTTVTPNSATRTISFSVNDGSSNSTAATRTVTVTDTDQSPVVTTTGGTTNYLGGSGAVVIDGSITVSDLDNSTQSSATVWISSGFHVGDVLSFINSSAVLFGNITGSYNSGTGTLTLTSAGATATVAKWANALDAITFAASSSVTPGNRTISFVSNDGTKSSAAATDLVAVTASPIVTTDSGSASFNRTSNSSVTPTQIDSGLTVTDASISTLSSGTVAITGNFHSGEDVLGFTNTAGMGNISASYNSATGILTLMSAGSTATVAQWQTALDSVTYADTSLSPNLSTRTISFTVTDGNSNPSNTATRTVTLLDSAAPGVVSVAVPANGTYSTGQNLNFTVIFDEAVAVDTTGGTPQIAITLDSGTLQANYLSGSGTTTLTFRATVLAGNVDADGITLAAGISPNGATIKDSSFNDAVVTLNNIASTTGILVDAVAPSIASINRHAPTGSIINATSAVFRVTFSKSVTGVDASDFSLTATSSAVGSIGSVSAVSGSVYDVTVTGLSGNGTLRLDLKSSGTGIADTSSNAIASGFTSGQTYTLDHLAPTVTSIVRQSPSGLNTSASSVTFRVSYSEAVTGVDTTAFDLTTVSGSAAGAITAVNAVSNSLYDVTVGNLTGLGAVRLDAIALGSVVIDNGGNTFATDFTTGDLYEIGATNVFDFTGLAPSSTRSVSKQLGFQTAQRFTTGANAPLTVFDLAAIVTSASSAQPVVTINQDENGSIGSVVGTLTNPAVLTANSLNIWTGDFTLEANTTYWVVFNDASTSGLYSIAYTAATTGGVGTWVTTNDYQFANYAAGAWTSQTGGLSIDIGAITAASVSSVTLPTNGSYIPGQNLDFVVNFGGPVTVTGAPTLKLTIGSAVQYATYVSGSGTNALVFRYTVQTGDIDADGITVDSSVSLNGGSIQDARGLDVTPSFTAASTAGVIVAAAPTSRLLNLSSRGQVGTGQNVLIAGFIITGTESKQVVLRGVGPALSNFGVQGGLAHPVIKLYDGGQNLLMSNAGWANDSAISNAFTAIGAVPFATDSADAALIATLPPGGYTLVVSGQNNTTGVALAEVYDASPSASEPHQKLVNIAGRGFVGTGENVLIGGFIISGNTPKQVLVRAIGPGLTKYSLTSALADPVLELHDATSVIAHNDNWETKEDSSTGDVATATTAVNAPALDAGSKDAAVVMTLAPGGYTAIVSGNSGTTGVALLEIYEVPQ